MKNQENLKKKEKQIVKMLNLHGTVEDSKLY
jgi:hypothetical protein